jgi:predicted Ser/Thr protein kinase
MTAPPNRNEPTVEPFAPRARRVCEQFEARWQEALEGGAPPVLEGAVLAVPEAERPALRMRLRRIEQKYGALGVGDPALAPPDGVEGPGPALTAGPPPPDTVRFPTAQPGAAEVATDHHLDLGPALPEPSKVATACRADDAALSSCEFALGDPPESSGEVMVPGYEILGELGRGGMGVVYLARQLNPDRLVALKMLRAGSPADASRPSPFHAEAEAVAHLEHPYVVQVYEVGEHDGRPYFALEYVDGGSLQQKLRGCPQPPREAAEMVEMLAQALACAHDQDIVHRDLKPANVLLTRGGMPKVTDFGLAKKLVGKCGRAEGGTLMGTPSYMAPEQAAGKTKDVGPLADVYALGVILYEMLTGRPPFIGPSIADTLRQVRVHEPVPPSRLQPSVPAALDTICLTCLRKEPRRRYPGAQALADDLRRFLRGEPIKPTPDRERFVRWCRRNRRVAALSGAMVVLLVSFVVGSAASAVVFARKHAAAVAAKQSADKAREEATKADPAK